MVQTLGDATGHFAIIRLDSMADWSIEARSCSVERIPDDALPVQMLRKLAAPTAAAFGVALLLVCVKHGRLLREAEVLSLIDSPFGRLSDIVERY